MYGRTAARTSSTCTRYYVLPRRVYSHSQPDVFVDFTEPPVERCPEVRALGRGEGRFLDHPAVLGEVRELLR